MLVLLVIVALVAAILAEDIGAYLAGNYEIDWGFMAARSRPSLAEEVARAMRRSREESERQMNGAFKVSSDACC